jgi:NADH dehydrogenase
MKSTVEALNLRYRLIQNFEEALAANDDAIFQQLMNVVVVGGGPTGVEISGALAEMKKYVLPKDYPELDFSKMNIYLLEGSDKTLGMMSDASSVRSKKYLEQLEVKVMTNAQVKDFNGTTVYLHDEKTISTRTVIWAAGIKGNIPGGLDKSLIAKGNRIKVDRANRVSGFENIFVIGDLAFMETTQHPGGHPQVAPVAIQQALLLAKNLIKLQKGKTDLLEFEYKDNFRWLFTWLIWMSPHLMLILGVKNKFFVFINWLYNYITYDQSLRLIFREFKK